MLQGYERLIDNRATSDGQLVVYQTAAIETEAQQAIRPEAIALAVFGAIALLAALIIGTQSISRLLYAGASETEVLRAMGATPAATMTDGLLGVAGAVVAGSLLAAAVAVALSPLSLFGPVRAVKPARAWTSTGPSSGRACSCWPSCSAWSPRPSPTGSPRTARRAVPGRPGGVPAWWPPRWPPGCPPPARRACGSPWSQAAAGPRSRSGRS